MKEIKPKKIRAAVMFGVKQPLRIIDVNIPPLNEGQVLVKVFFSGVCRSQVMEFEGERGEDKWLPHFLGHEGSGKVIDLGKGVKKVKKGDEVILGWIKGEGKDAFGPKFKYKNQSINAGQVTTFSNYSIVSENRLIKKPKSLPFDQAVLFGCALPTGAGMVLNEINPKSKDLVAVLGLGGVGISALIALKAIGVKKIVAIDILEEKLNLAIKLGASHALNAKDKKFFKSFYNLYKDGADYCFESGGQISTIELGFSLLNKNKGKLLFASHPADGEKISLLPHELISGKQITGSWGGGTSPDKDIPNMIKLFNLKKIKLDWMISKRYPLEKINEALKDLEVGKVNRPLIVMDHNE